MEQGLFIKHWSNTLLSRLLFLWLVAVHPKHNCILRQFQGFLGLRRVLITLRSKTMHYTREMVVEVRYLRIVWYS
jgi:hypothetical protein